MKKIVFLLLFVFGVTNAQIVNIPDANFKAKLLSATVNNIVAGVQNYYYSEPSCTGNDIATPSEHVKIDTNNDGQIQYSEAQVIKSLNISGSNITNLTGIEAFINLQVLSCSLNQLTSLNLSQNVNLRVLDCGFNPITNFDVSQYPSLYYLNCFGLQTSSLDISQNLNLKSLTCGSQILSNLTLSQNLKVLQCSNSPLLTSLSLSQCTNLKRVYISYASLTTLDVSLNSNLIDITISNLPISNLDVSQNSLLCYLGVQNTQIATLDLSNNTNLGNISCSNNQLLTYLNIKNGSSQYGWPGSSIYSNPNLHFICADDNEVSSAQSSVGPNVLVSSYCSFVPGGNYNTISGSILFDSDSNGCDTSDLAWSNIKVTISNGTNQGSSFTTNSGNYSFFTQSGNFILTPNIENSTWFNFSPVTAEVPFANNNNNSFTQNFCLSPNGIHQDVEVIILATSIIRAGNNSNYRIVYKNKGNQTLSGILEFNYNDAIFDYVSSTVIPNSTATGSLGFDYTNLMPFETRSIDVILNLNSPTETPPVNIGDIINLLASITPVSGDEIPNDNLFSFNQSVVGSLDPNDKNCLEGTIVDSSKIGDYLHYNINFENIGNAAAENIVVKDMIDTTKFDITSLQIINSSHSMTARITGNKVEFVFDNINLDPSQHGNVAFKIKTKTTLVEGDTVTNNANIYFDYNFPIQTNTASTIFQTLSSGQFEIDNSVGIAPNPTKNNVNVNCNNNIQSVQLFDVQGRVLTTQIVTNSQSVLNISNYTNGIYFVKVTTEKGSKVVKIIKE